MSKKIKRKKRKIYHFNDNGILWGYSRRHGDTSQEIKTFVNELIIYYGQKAKYKDIPDEDIEKILAIADHEAEFNPEAATRNPESSASGVFQITDTSARDVSERLIKKSPVKMDITGYDRFDPDSNIKHGILIYFDKKRQANSGNIKNIYREYNPNASPEVLNKVNNIYEKKYKGTLSRMKISLVRPDRDWPPQNDPSEDKYWDALHRFDDEITNRYGDILNNRRG